MSRNENLDELVSNIVNHPNLRESLSAAFNSRRDQGDARTISATPPTNSITARPARPTTNNRPRPNGNNVNFAGPGRSESRTFEHPNDELSSIFRVGGSSSQVRNPHLFERGVNHHRHRQGPYSRPSTTRTRSSIDSGRSNARQKFVVKEVVLIPNPEEGSVLRASKRATLMSSGYVLNDVELDRTWTEDVLLEYLSGLFSSKFLDENDSSSRR